MRLLITTPTALVIDDHDVVAVRAEDESGGFGILSGHGDFLTALTVSVVSCIVRATISALGRKPRRVSVTKATRSRSPPARRCG